MTHRARAYILCVGPRVPDSTDVRADPEAGYRVDVMANEEGCVQCHARRVLLVRAHVVRLAQRLVVKQTQAYAARSPDCKWAPLEEWKTVELKESKPKSGTRLELEAKAKRGLLNKVHGAITLKIMQLLTEVFCKVLTECEGSVCHTLPPAGYLPKMDCTCLSLLLT